MPPTQFDSALPTTPLRVNDAGPWVTVQFYLTGSALISVTELSQMARCDEGYPCEVCGQDVEDITGSDLYLRFVLGEVSIDRLHRLPERHIRCNPALAQYIVDSSFAEIECPGPFDKRELDPAYVKIEQTRITRAWRRLQMLPTLGLPIHEYPLMDRNS